jgi:Flp pilus assembly protein TadG
MAMSTDSRKHLHRRGAAAAEFAVLVPLLAVLVIGILEVSRAIMVKAALTDAARLGARLASFPGGTDTTVMNEVTALVQRNCHTSNVTVIIQVNGVTSSGTLLASAVRGDKINVAVAVPIADVGWAYGWFLKGYNVESESVAMLRQR